MPLTPAKTPIRSSGGLVLSLLVLGLLLCSAGCMPRAAQRTDAKPVAQAAPKPGVRFPRADLVDVASFISDRTGTGFVLASPDLRTLPLTLYMPVDATAQQLEAMFVVALEANGVRALERDGYWLIVHDVPGRTQSVAGHGEMRGDEGMVLDFRGAPIAQVTGFVSEVTGKRFIITGNAGKRDITLQALQPVSAAEAFDLLLTTLRAEGLVVSEDGDTIAIEGRASYAVDEAPDKDARKKDR